MNRPGQPRPVRGSRGAPDAGDYSEVDPAYDDHLSEAPSGPGGRGGESRPPAWQPASAEDTMMYVAGFVALGVGALAAVALGAGHLSARLLGDAWPEYELADAPGILGRLVTNPGEPAVAWEPVNSGGEVPGAIAWWLTFVVMVLLLGALATLVYALNRGSVSNLRRRSAPGHDDTMGSWAGDRELKALRLDPKESATERLVVGLRGKQKLATNRLESLLVIGPAHAGKTSGLGIPTLLEWDGPAVVASTKAHLMEETIGWRSHHGDVRVFDPAGSSRFPRSGWILLDACDTWQSSIRMAQHLTLAAKASVGGAIDGGDASTIENGMLWSGAMAMSLAPYLYAAALDGRDIIEAAEWVEREERDAVLDILEPVDAKAAHAHETTFFRDNPSRSAFFHVMYQVLSVYGDPIVAETTERHEMDASELLNGGRNTWYLTAPEHDQIRFRPLFAAIVRQVTTAINDRFATKGEALHPPLLLLLDDAAGVATVEGLANVANTGITKGVQVISIFEDLGRFEAVNPDAVRILSRAHRNHLMLPGCPYDELLAPNLAAELNDGEGALDFGGPRPARLRLRRWYREGELKRQVEAHRGVLTADERRAAAMGRDPVGDAPDYNLVDQARPGRGRGRARPVPESPIGSANGLLSEIARARKRRKGSTGNVFSGPSGTTDAE